MKILFKKLWWILPFSILICSCCTSCSNIKNCCTSDSKKMKTETNTCSHCGNTSCDANCSANKTQLRDSIGAISSCSLNPEVQSTRFVEIKKEIFSKSIHNKELKDGMEFTFQEPKEFNNTLLEFIEFERGCCKDFTFSLHFEPRNGPVTLRMTGSEEITKILKN